jgi:hypothetical protein
VEDAPIVHIRNFHDHTFHDTNRPQTPIFDRGLTVKMAARLSPETDHKPRPIPPNLAVRKW